VSAALAAARRVGSEVAARHAADVDAGARFPVESFDALKAERLLGLLVPSERGGLGGSMADVVAVCHALGQHCASTAMIYAMHQIQVACLVRHGSGSAWHAGDPGLGETVQQFGPGLQLLRRHKGLRFEIVEGASHTFAERAARDRLTVLLDAFLADWVAAPVPLRRAA